VISSLHFRARRGAPPAVQHAVGPRLFAGVMAALVLAALGVPRSLVAAAPQDARPTVAVMYFNNGALMKHADYQPLSKGIADVLITELASNDSIRVVERDQLQKLLEEQDLNNTDRVDKATAVKIGRILGAQHMIFGGFVIDPKGRMRLDARAVNVATSEIEYVETVTDKADNVLQMIATLADKLNAGMKLPSTPGMRMGSAQHTRSNPTALKSLILYARAVGAQDAKDTHQAATLYKQFLDTSPSTILVAQRKYAESKLRSLGESS
jgi:TolB-like protein